jgi:hypothetical protein
MKSSRARNVDDPSSILIVDIPPETKAGPSSVLTEAETKGAANDDESE